MKYEFPVKFHRFTTDEFTKLKEKYIAKYGYTINLPGINDIIKIGGIREPTKEENRLYRNANIEELGPSRYYDLKKLKAQKKASFLRMLSSPVPEVVQNIGTVMTFLDDINDSLGTLGVIGRTAIHFLPRALQAVFTGPLAYLFWAADAIELLQYFSPEGATFKMLKANAERYSKNHPNVKKGKIRNAKKLTRLVPSKGEVIEMLQTTENMFGIGLSLGPIIGGLEESVFGPVRVLQGKKVRVAWPTLPTTSWERTALQIIGAAPAVLSINPVVSDQDYFKFLILYDRAIQVLYPYFQEQNPLDSIDSIHDVYIQAPSPTNPMTLDVFEESGVYPDEHIGFPFMHTALANLEEMPEVYEVRIYLRMISFLQRNHSNFIGQLGAELISQIGLNLLALMEGEENVLIDIDPAWKMVNSILVGGYTLPPNLKPWHYECIRYFCASHYTDFDSWPLDYIQKYLHDFCGITLIQPNH